MIILKNDDIHVRSALLLCFFFSISYQSKAHDPVPLSNAELVKSDIILIAKWVGPYQTLHEKFIWDDELGGLECSAAESFTMIEVLKVLKINGRKQMKMGKCRILTDINLCFPFTGPNRKPVVSADPESGKFESDAKDISIPTIWFLAWKKSWQDGKRYPALVNFRSVQPLDRLPEFMKFVH